MVYCGKPSRGCQMCRTRRIKCDETKPTCNQCAKSRRTCPGYKDEFDLVFRNETQATERRARKASRKALAQKQAKETDASRPHFHSASTSPASTSPAWTSPASSVEACVIPVSPRICVKDQATCHFISNFVLVPRQGGVRGFMEFLIPLMKMDYVPPHFRHSFYACALASLNNRVGTGHDLEKEAVGMYSLALTATYTAVRDPEVSKQDATLASVLLLGLFENITARNVGTLAWGTHTEGAIQLTRARGRKQLRTKIGLAMFIAVRTQMVGFIMSCLALGHSATLLTGYLSRQIIHSLSTSRCPIMGTDWWMNDTVRDQNAADCQRLNIIVGELRAEANNLLTLASRNPEDVSKIMDMIKRCQAHDVACANWSNNLPDYFQWKTVAWEDNVPHGDYKKADVYPGRVDAYQDTWILSVWNMMRCSRLLLASIIVRCAAWLSSPVDYRTTPEYAAAARTCVDTITDIIASVPWQLGWLSKRQDVAKRSHLSTFECGHEDAPKGLGGYFLTWPLACIHGQDYLTDSQRTWVQGRLEFIGTRLGVRYAHMLTQLNLRVPSMLIRRDGLVARPYPHSPDCERLLSANAIPQLSGSDVTRLPQSRAIQQREARQRETVERQTAELLTKVIGTSGQMGERTAKTWLQLPQLRDHQQHRQQTCLTSEEHIFGHVI